MIKNVFFFQCLQGWFQAVIYLNLWTGILIKNVLTDGPIASLSFNCPAVIFEATLFLITATYFLKFVQIVKTQFDTRVNWDTDTKFH